MSCSAPWMLCLINQHLEDVEQIFSNVQNNSTHGRCMNIELILLHSTYTIFCCEINKTCFKLKTLLAQPATFNKIIICNNQDIPQHP